MRLLLPLACTGLKPHFLEKLAGNGVTLPPTFFDAGRDHLRPAFSGAGFGSPQ
jgi:hypothetical protein